MSRGVAVAATVLAAVLLAACGSKHPPTTTAGLRADTKPIPRKLLAGVRPIGRGPRFRPPLTGAPVSACTTELGKRDQAHIEVFGANRVVLLSAGIGTRPSRSFLDGRLTHARCFGALVTLDPTGTVYFRPGAGPTLTTLFSEWGYPLGRKRLASFSGRVRVYINGHPSRVSPPLVRIAPGAEIVLEVGPYIPPHARFSFPAPPSSTLS